MKQGGKVSGFTLIELLIVVAIIAILAAIAVPNFLEAQMRSKISRVKADQRTIAMALEAYAIDNLNTYPNMHLYPPGAAWIYVGWGYAQKKLTTPVPYMTSLLPDTFQLRYDQLTTHLRTRDMWLRGNPFQDPSYDPVANGDQHVMDYENFVEGGNPNNATWVERWYMSYGPTMWKLQSFGPMRETYSYGWATTTSEPGWPNRYYDPTNGTVSRGLITRTQARWL